MTITSAFHEFITDEKVRILLIIIAVDLILGIIASLKTKTFSLGYITGFLKDDIAFKVIPYFVFYFAALIAGNQDVVIPGLDLGIVAGTVYGLIIAAMVASILGSIKDLGFQGLSGLPSSLTDTHPSPNPSPPPS